MGTSADGADKARMEGASGGVYVLPLAPSATAWHLVGSRSRGGCCPLGSGSVVVGGKRTDFRTTTRA